MTKLFKLEFFNNSIHIKRDKRCKKLSNFTYDDLDVFLNNNGLDVIIHDDIVYLFNCHQMYICDNLRYELEKVLLFNITLILKAIKKKEEKVLRNEILKRILKKKKIIMT